MDRQYPFVKLDVSARNVAPSGAMRTTSVVMRLEKKVDNYIIGLDGQRILTGTYQSSPPQFFNFNLHSDITSSEIFEILHTQHNISFQLSLFLTSHISRLATFMELGRNVFIMTLLVTVTSANVFEFDFSAFTGGEASEEEEGEEEEDVIEKLVMEGEIGKNPELETESCSICLDNLMGVPGKAPTRMPCSHIFHDDCISQWLYQKDSCPLCRTVLYKI